MAGTSSCNPTENVPNDARAAVVSDTSGRRRKHCALTISSDLERLPTKRKLDLGSEIGSDPSGLQEFDIPMVGADFDTFCSGEQLDRVLVGEKDHGLDDFLGISEEDYQLDGSSMPHSSSSLNVAQNIPPTPNDFGFSSTLHGRLYINLTD
jgi:hypothetical protein